MIRKFPLVILGLATILFSWKMFTAWRIETEQSVTCTVPQLKKPLRYYEIVLQEQDPIYPEYKSKIFFLYSDPSNTETASRELTIGRSPVGTYLRETVTTQLLYDPSRHVLKMRDSEELGLISQGRLHRYFPFDSARFNFDIDADPWLEPSVLRVTNRVPGFILNCKSVKNERIDNQIVRIVFKLKRSPLIFFASVVLCIAALIFMVLILKLENTEGLSSATASFFFSIWSVRGIFSSVIKIFPTLMDCWLLLLCSLMPILLLLRLALRKKHT